MGGAPSAEGSSDEEVDTLGLYKQIIELLKPGETLTKVCVWSVWSVWVCVWSVWVCMGVWACVWSVWVCMGVWACVYSGASEEYH